jgi:hypothetical protein
MTQVNSQMPRVIQYDPTQDQFSLDASASGGPTPISRQEVNDILKQWDLTLASGRGADVQAPDGAKYSWDFAQSAMGSNFAPVLPVSVYTKGDEINAFSQLQSTGEIATSVGRGNSFMIFFELLKSARLEAFTQSELSRQEFRAQVAMLVKSAEMELDKVKEERKKAALDFGAALAGAAVGSYTGNSTASTAVTSGVKMIDKCYPGMPGYNIDMINIAQKWVDVYKTQHEEMKRDADKASDAARSMFKQALDMLKAMSKKYDFRDIRVI